MKKIIPTILFTLSLTTPLFGLNIGQEIELNAYLNARTSPNFLKYAKNIKTTLPPNTTGKILEIKEFVEKGGKKKSGNAGLKIQVTSGPNAGKSYWIYYDVSAPALKLVDQRTQEKVKIEQIPHTIVEVDQVVLAKLPEGEKLPKLEKAAKIEKIPDTKLESLPTIKAITPVTQEEELPEGVTIIDETDEGKAEAASKLAAAKSATATEGLEIKPQGFNEVPYKPTAKTLVAANDVKAITLEPVTASRDLSEHIIETVAKESAHLSTDVKATLEAAEKQRMIDCLKTQSEVESKKANDSASDKKVKFEGVYSPLQALADINGSELKFMGRKLMPGSGKNQSCVFQNDKVFVVYHNCMSNKKEAPATDIEVLSKDGGVINFYGEMFDQGKPFSERTRSEYKGTWAIRYTPTEPLKKAGMNEIANRLEQYQTGSITGCSTSAEGTSQCSDGIKYKRDEATGNMTDIPTPGWSKAVKNQEWKEAADEFWKNPTPEWYSTQIKLRKLIQKAPF